jgi:tetratricopeptide (TPR) repeat protein
MIHTTTLGVMQHEMGDLDDAYRLLSDAHAQAQALGDPHALTFVSSFLSRTAQALGRTDETAALLRDGLAQAIEMEDPFSMAIAWEQLGREALDQGKIEEAYHSYGLSISLYNDMGDDQSLARMLNKLGDANRQAGDVGLAEEHYRKVLVLALQNGTKGPAHYALYSLAQLFSEQDRAVWSWALTAILLKLQVSPNLLAQVEALQEAVQPMLTDDEQTAVLNWIGERPTTALIQDILQDRIPSP